MHQVAIHMKSEQDNSLVAIATHIKEMLEQRGYDVEKFELVFENGPYFKKQKSSEREYMKVYMARYMSELNLDINNLEITEAAAKNIINEILKDIVANIPPKTKAITIFPQELLDKYNPEKNIFTKKTQAIKGFYEKMVIFSEADFKFNPTKHDWVPKHELASEKDIALLKSRKITEDELSKLPKLLKSDVICKWYGFQPGNVVVIHRSIEEGEPYYRYVSDG
jgi:DNA-directed RNA polymerase subunit H (RpoH/RPB5)